MTKTLEAHDKLIREIFVGGLSKATEIRVKLKPSYWRGGILMLG